MATITLHWLTRERMARGRRIPSPLDMLVTLAILAVGVIEAVSGAFPGPSWLALAVQVTSIGAVAFRRIAPLPAIAISAAIYLPHAVVYGSPGSLSQLLVGLVLLHAVGRHADARGALAGSAIGLLLIVIQGIRGALVSPADWTFALVFSAVAVGIGVAQRRQTQQASQLSEAANEARRQRAAAAEAAAVKERRRIARELHDVVAHNVGLIVLQAGGGRSVLAADRDRAREALERIETTGRQTLAEMRQLVGILRQDDAVRAPLPRLDDLSAVVGELRATGLDVKLEVEGAPAEVPIGVEVAAFRIAQEALTNVRKHAPGASARLRVCHGPDVLSIEVQNTAGRVDPPAPAGQPGHGLLGMRERARLYGGTFDAGPDDDGGFRVTATIPRGGAA